MCRLDALFVSAAAVVVVVVVVASVPCGATDAHPAPRQTDEARTRRPLKRSRTTTESSIPSEIPYWMCPDVACVPLPTTCALVEYIVYETPYVVNGNKVRCQSCSYCLDMPSSSSSSSSASNQAGARSKRSSSVLINRLTEELKKCSLTCPDVQTPCMDSRLTPVHLGSTPCGQCPVCYDNAPVTSPL